MNNQCGGEVIGAGGFGCVFKPQLWCKNTSGPIHHNGISKLLHVQDANAEMQDISNIIPIIDKIPNNQRYFLPNVDEQFYDCQISQFTSKDIKNIEICSKIFFKNDITNLSLNTLNNNNKNKFRIIQQPYGGEELYKYIKNLDQQILNIDILQDINKKLCNLLKNGIKPMNDAGLLHHDIKLDNILYDTSTGNVRLIDWGLSKNLNELNDNQLKQLAAKCSEEANFNTLPTNVLFYLFKFNITRITRDHINLIFNDYFKNSYTKFTISLQILNPELKDNNSIINFLNNFITSDVLSKYNDDPVQYFTDIYAKNCDIFGFLSCYVDIIKIVNNKLDYIQRKNNILQNQKKIFTEHEKASIKFAQVESNKLPKRLRKAISNLDHFLHKNSDWFKLKNIINNLKELCLHYMYSKSATESIDVDKLINDLNDIFNGKNFEIQSGGKKTLKKYKRNKGKTQKSKNHKKIKNHKKTKNYKKLNKKHTKKIYKNNKF